MTDRNRSYELALDKLRILLDTRQREDEEFQRMQQHKEEVLREFGQIFSREHLYELTADQMKSFLSFKQNHHWTGLHRPSSKICDDMTSLRENLKGLLYGAEDIATRFDRADKAVEGMGQGIATAILFVSSRKEFGVWNSKSENAIKDFNLWPKCSRGSSKGEKYVAINELLKKLAADLNTDLWDLDSLWHFYLEAKKDLAEGIGSMTDEDVVPGEYLEGHRVPVTVNKYERSSKARAKCIEHHGAVCKVCQMDFASTYGELGEGFIHVHHILPLSKKDKDSYTVDPIEDLKPVCPNCHAMLHRGSETISLEKLRRIRKDLADAHRRA